MPVTVIDRGHGNRIYIDPAVLAKGTGTVTAAGDSNDIEIGANCVLINAQIHVGHNCVIIIAAGCRLAQIDIHATKKGEVRIGRGTSFTSQSKIYLHEPGFIQIGEDCMIASHTMFTVSDMHPIIDVVSRERLNPPANITIGDRVWIGAEVAVMKGVEIGAGSVVGFRSIVTKNLPETCLAVGSPARFIRHAVTWLRHF